MPAWLDSDGVYYNQMIMYQVGFCQLCQVFDTEYTIGF